MFIWANGRFTTLSCHTYLEKADVAQGDGMLVDPSLDHLVRAQQRLRNCEAERLRFAERCRHMLAAFEAQVLPLIQVKRRDFGQA